MLSEATFDGSARDKRRERLILFILAAVQFTTIVDFMIVLPLGPQLMRKLEISPHNLAWSSLLIRLRPPLRDWSLRRSSTAFLGGRCLSFFMPDSSWVPCFAALRRTTTR